MDVSAIATSMMTSQAQSRNDSLAAKFLKNNADAERQVVETLIEKPAMTSSNLGRTVDVSV
jgi:hypothetical protein